MGMVSSGPSGAGRLNAPWSSSNASPDGVWRSCGRGLGCVVVVVVRLVVVNDLGWRVTAVEGVAMMSEVLVLDLLPRLDCWCLSFFGVRILVH